MKKGLKYFVVLSILLITAQLLHSTTIMPFQNLGEMTKATSVVVFAKAIDSYEVDMNGSTRYRTDFRIIERIKGDIENQFSIQDLRMKQGDLNRIVFGDVDFEVGESYLLFLEDKGEYYIPIMLSHGIFQKRMKNGQSLLSPVEEGLNYFMVDQGEKEAFYVYDLERLVQLLKDIEGGKANWDSELVKTEYPIAWFEEGKRAEPDHCTYIGAPAPYARWTDFPDTALPVHYSAAGSADCADAHSTVQSAISTLNTNYKGISLSDGGTHSFVPSCGGGEGATDSEFLTFVTGLPGGYRNLLVLFDDPCGEITDLVGCNGTLAFGGLYWSGSTHTYDGVNWNNALAGYVILNNALGGCHCGASTYEEIIGHEITHSLGMGHISSSTGTANMNPSCCSGITTFDLQCLDYTYAPAIGLPLELHSFEANLEGQKVFLNWKTDFEKDIAFYTVERSTDGENFESMEFLTVSEVNKEGKEYNLIDHSPSPGKNYYRLKVTDLDQREEYIGDIQVVGFYYNMEKILVSPNPIKNNMLNVNLNLTQSGKVDFQLIDLNGRIKEKHSFWAETGFNNFRIELENLRAGIYLLKTSQGQELFFNKVVKAK